NAGISSQNGSRVKLYNNIVAFNTGTNTGANCRQVYQGNNNIQFPEKKGNNSTLCVNNPIIKDPKLGSLKNNGGPTKTFALLSGSPAINAGDNNRSTSADQRGVSRVGKSDIGAFEYSGGSSDPNPPPAPIENEGNFTITTKETGNGSIQLSPTGPYSAGQTVTVTAVPNNGASFKEFRWGFGGLITTNNPYVLSISKSVTIEAIFEGGSGGGTDPDPDPDPNPNPGNINLTTKINGNGSIQLSPQGPYSAGQNVTVKAIPASGATFKDLRWGFGGLITTNDTYVFSISKNVTIQATFEGGNGGGTDPDPDPNPNPGDINITTRVNGNGNIQLSPQGPYSQGQTVTVTAVPDNGASFKDLRWGFGGLITTNPKYVFDISKNVTIEANFQGGSSGGTDPDPNPNPGTFTITTKTDGNGSIQLNPQGPYSQGQQVTVTAIPNNGFTFNDFRWGFGGLITTNSPYVFNIQNDVTIQASFNAQGGGGTDPDPSPGSGAFVENNGQVIINVPSVGLNSNSNRAWKIQSIGGQNYYQTKEGQNSFNKLTTYGIITYPVSINTPGIYRIMMKSKINKSNRTDEHNDMWLKMPNNGNVSFFAYRGNVSSEQTLQNALNANNVLWPKGIGKTPNPDGASTQGYLKVYTNKIGPAYVMKTNDGPGHEIYVKFNKSGTYNLQIAHRSDGFAVRRLAMWKVNTYGDGYNKNGRNGLNSLDSQPQSARAGNKATASQQSANSYNELIQVVNASPNPIIGENVKLQLSAPFQGNLTYALYSVLGQKIDEAQVFVEQPQSSVQIDLSQMKKDGVHYLKVVGDQMATEVIRIAK
ncbi:MAG: choice-of-anchor Q domain-containing protein, partial [Bacteroidota bacterium]